MNRSRLVGSRFSRLLASQPLELVPPVVLAALRAELQTLISVEAQAFSAYDAFWTFSHTSILRDRNTSWHSIFTPSNLRVLKKTERCDGNVVGGQEGWTGGTRTDTRCLRQQRHSQDKQGNGTQHVLSLPQGSIHTYYVQPTERERDTTERELQPTPATRSHHKRPAHTVPTSSVQITLSPVVDIHRMRWQSHTCQAREQHEPTETYNN